MRAHHIGIAGAGLLGRLAAWVLASQGHRVEVFDPAPGPAPLFNGQGAAGFTAAGMLSPVAERESADAALAELGWRSIALWEGLSAALHAQGWVQQAPECPLFTGLGSLLVAHGPDLGAARRVLTRLDDGTLAPARQPSPLTREALQGLEPELHGSSGPLHAWMLPGEAHIDTVRTLNALHAAATATGQVQWHWGQAVQSVAPGALHTPRGRYAFDTALDLRGTGARPACAVRGVRGELVWLHAPGVRLSRPVRLLHPRHRVYIVPRAGDRILVGASEIETEDRSPMSLRSAVELMAAAHSVLPALAEARIERLDVNLRPALPDHHPEVHHAPGLLRINGLYRHGWLLAPALLERALHDQALAPLGLLS